MFMAIALCKNYGYQGLIEGIVLNALLTSNIYLKYEYQGHDYQSDITCIS